MAISFANGSKGRSASTASQATGAVTTAAAGSTFVVFALWDTAQTFSSIVDSKGNTYTLIDSELAISFGRARLYYCQNGAGGASHTATIALSAAASITVLFGEILGGLTSGILDQHSNNLDAASPYTLTAGLTTLQAAELLLSALGGNSGSNPATHAESGLGTSTVQSAAEETNGSSFWTAALATSVKAATGTFNPSWTESGGVNSLGVFLSTFKEAAAGDILMGQVLT